MKKIALICAVFFSLTLGAFAYTSPGAPTGYVNDYTGTLSTSVKQSLEAELQLFAASTTNEIAVVIISSLEGDSVENYAVKLFEEWKIGNAKNDNGVLLLIAKNDHKLRIEVGYGLEGVLPDILAKDIIDTKITSAFKQGDYDKGTIEGAHAIMQTTQGEYTASATHTSNNSFFEDAPIEFILMILVFIIQFLSSIFARSKSWWAGGVVGGVLGGAMAYNGVFSLFGNSLIAGSVFTFILVLLGLLFDYIVSTGYKNAVNSGSSIPWWSGGGGFGSGHSSSRSSFGGFGGGSSGGGGASGSW